MGVVDKDDESVFIRNNHRCPKCGAVVEVRNEEVKGPDESTKIVIAGIIVVFFIILFFYWSPTRPPAV